MINTMIDNRIIFKKNIAIDFENFLREKYSCAKALIISGYCAKTLLLPDVINVLNAINASYNVFSLSKNEKFSNENISEALALKYKNFNVVICVGGGNVCDFSKIIATKFNCPLIVLPTIASIGFFNSEIAYKDFANIKCSAEKIFIEENIISSLDNDAFVFAKNSLLGLLTAINEKICEGYIIGQSFDARFVKSKDLINAYFIDNMSIPYENEKRVKLMDVCVEVGNLLNGENLSMQSFYCLSSEVFLTLKNKSMSDINGVCSIVLQEMFKQFLSIDKIQVFNVLMANNTIYNKRTEMLLDSNLFLYKLNSIKHLVLDFVCSEINIVKTFASVNKFYEVDKLYDCVHSIASKEDAGFMIMLMRGVGLV